MNSVYWGRKTYGGVLLVRHYWPMGMWVSMFYDGTTPEQARANPGTSKWPA